MPGRIPKPKSQRARVNKTMGAQLPREGSGVDAPDYPNADASLYALDYWQRIWTSPMGVVYLDADVPALVRLTELVDYWHVGKDGSVLGEIRQLEDRFGLSPLSRRRLEWEITAAGGKPDAPEMPNTDEDDRWLKVV